MRGESGISTRATRFLTWLFVVCILGWVVPVLLMLDRGFAIADEGSYVLSYRFWSSNPYFVSGSQYLYGPVFEAFKESIPALRVLRLVMVVLANAWFARCFLAWLQQRAPGSLPSSRTTLGLLLVAAGGMSYLWAPLTPGYYDLTADCSLVLVGLMLLTLARSPAPPVWIPVAVGAVVVALGLTKWTALTVAVVTVGVAELSLARRSRGAALRYGGLLLAGIIAALLACQVWLVPLGHSLEVMRQVSSLTAVGNHSLSYLAGKNVADTLTALAGAVVLGLPLVAASVLAGAQSRRGREDRSRRWLVAGAVVTVAVLPFVLGWHGGADRGRVVVSIALAGLLVALLAAVVPGPRTSLPHDRTGRLVAAVLLLVPLLQAAGTNVPLMYVAFECLSLWVALALLAVARPGCPPLVTWAVLADLAVVVVATAMICGTTTLVSPFKTSGYADATADVPGLGLRVAPTTARRYDALTQALAPYVRSGSPVFAMDENAGLTYLSGGVPAGSTWNDAASPTRTAGILRLACRNGDVPGPPVLLLSRPVDTSLASALADCGFRYPGGYRRLAVRDGPRGLTVLVPAPAS